MTNSTSNFVDLTKSSAFAIIISRIFRIFKILVLIRRHKRKAVKQTRDNNLFNQLLIESTNYLKETYILDENMQIALIINIIKFIIQYKSTKIITLTTINDKIDNVTKT